MATNTLKLVAAAAISLTSLQVVATPIIMEGNYIKTAVSDDGTLGYGKKTSPGIQHDASGTGSFGVDDYLTPGTPWETFSVKSQESGLLSNNNAFGGNISGSLTDHSASSAYDHFVTWNGSYSSLFSIETDTFFNNGDERISFSTSITANTSLTELMFLRALDPDPDVNTYGSFDTVNGRGATGLAAEDWVHSQGSHTGLTIGLYSDSDVTHNTGITGWSSDPADYLSGLDVGNGDNTIGLAFDLGNLLAGETVTFVYHYVMGDSLDTVDLPVVDVPEPGLLALFGLGFGLVSFTRRRKD